MRIDKSLSLKLMNDSMLISKKRRKKKGKKKKSKFDQKPSVSGKKGILEEGERERVRERVKACSLFCALAFHKCQIDKSLELLGG